VVDGAVVVVGLVVDARDVVVVVGSAKFSQINAFRVKREQ
jgi:hypothetical protein